LGKTPDEWVGSVYRTRAYAGKIDDPESCNAKTCASPNSDSEFHAAAPRTSYA
jgi:hypothetical protein